MALAQFTRNYPSSWDSIEPVKTALQEFDQLFIDAGLTLVTAESTDLNALDSTVLAPTTSSLQAGSPIYRVYELNDDFSPAAPMHIRLAFRTVKNGASGASRMLQALQVAVYPELQTPFSVASSWKVGTSYALANLHHPLSTGSTNSAYILVANTAPITSTVFLDKERGALAVLLAPGLFSLPGSSGRPPLNDTETAAAFYLSRAPRADGTIDADKVILTAPYSSAPGSVSSTSMEQWVYQAGTTLSLGNFSGTVATLRGSFELAQRRLSRDAKAVASEVPGMYRWVGEGAAAMHTLGLPAIQMGVYSSDQGIRSYPDVAMVYTGTYGGGLPRGSIFSVDNGVETYDYLNVGTLPTLESLENGAAIGWAFRLGLTNA